MDDKIIIQKFFERNEEAISISKEKYGEYCTYIAHNILLNHEDEEECMNDVLLAAWNSIPPQKPDNLKTYLGKLARNMAIDRWRKNKAQKRNTDDSIMLFEEIEEMVGKNTVESSIDSAELSAEISKFLRSIREIDRKVFVRRYWYGDSIEAICNFYGLSKSNASMILKRTREKLAVHLKKEGYLV